MTNKRREGRPQPTDPQLIEVHASMERQSYWRTLRTLCQNLGTITTGRAQKRFGRLSEFLWSQIE